MTAIDDPRHLNPITRADRLGAALLFRKAAQGPPPLWQGPCVNCGNKDVLELTVINDQVTMFCVRCGDYPNWLKLEHDAYLPSWEPSNAGTEPLDIPLSLIDWATAFNRPHVDAVLDGLLFPGRWTGIVAPAKQGKSTLALHIAHCLARGFDPFTGNPQDPVPVLYLDGEMGELDVIERLAELELSPDHLELLHYTDIVPKGDTVQGGAAIVSAAIALNVAAVFLDGMNAFVTGAEKDDTPWRNLYENTVSPLKRAGKAVMSSDNTGKDTSLSARGSSVKLDKADAIIELKRTDEGVTLKTTHQRTSAYLGTIDLAVEGLDGNKPITFSHALSSWPSGTRDGAALLDKLGVPLTAGRDKARQALKQAGISLQNETLSAAIRWRKTCPRTGHIMSNGQTSGQAEENDF